MPFQVSCPTCERKLSVPDSLAGQRVKCPGCANTFTAQEDGTQEAAATQSEERLSSRPPAPEPPEDRPPRWRDDEEDWHSRRGGTPGDYAAHRGGLILTLGIVSCSLGALEVLAFAGMLCCGPLAFAGLLCSATALGLGLPSWIMGQGDLKKIRSGNMDPAGEASTKGGWVCGLIGTILGGLGLLCGIIGIVLAVLVLGLSIASR
jgi:hypothetical protein